MDTTLDTNMLQHRHTRSSKIDLVREGRREKLVVRIPPTNLLTKLTTLVDKKKHRYAIRLKLNIIACNRIIIQHENHCFKSESE